MDAVDLCFLDAAVIIKMPLAPAVPGLVISDLHLNASEFLSTGFVKHFPNVFVKITFLIS